MRLTRWSGARAFALLLALGACNGAGSGAALDGGTAGEDAGAGAGAGEDGGRVGCASQSQEVQLAPLDMVLAIDTSYSMDFDGKWTAVKAAIKSFVNDTRFHGLGLGLQFFPARALCSVSAYETPAVGIGAIPAVSPAIEAALDAQRLGLGTPLAPMLQGMVTYSRAEAAAHPDRKTVLVVATDGIPDDSCIAPSAGILANTIQNVVMLAGAAQSGTPSIPVFVVGVGSDAVGQAQQNQIAQAGGTQSAILVDTAQDIEAAFLAALNNIRKTAIACEYVIPTPSGMDEIDYTRVNVDYSVGGAHESFFYVKDQAGCQAAPDKGWYYDDPANPKKVLLCGPTCDKVKASDAGRVDVVFGCKTLIL